MPNDESKFFIPIEESRRSRFGTQEQKALGRRLAGQISSRAIDRPTIGKRRNRSFGSGATGGIAGSLDPRDMSMVDFDRDGWAKEGSTNPVWVGVKPADRLSSLSSGNEKTKPRKPSYPRKPTYGPLLGRANEVFKGVTNWEEFKQRYQDTEITYIDYETTGLVFDKWGKSSGNGAPVQIGAIKVKNGKVTARFEMYINPNMPFDKWEKWSRDTLVDYEQNPLSDKFLSDKASIAEAHRKLVEFIGPNAILGVQNAAFDKDVLEDNLSASGIDWRPDGWIDLKDVAGMTLPRWSEESQDGPKRFDTESNKWVPSNSLKDITKYLGVALEGHHTADVDAEATANSMDELIDRAIKNNWNVDLFDPTKRDNLIAKSEKKYKEDMDAFPEKVEKYLQILEDLDAAEKRSLSSGDKTNKKQPKTRPIIKMNPGEKSKLKQHRQTDYNYGDKSELGGQIRRSKNDWMKGMTSQQMAKLLVPESKQQHFDMWLDDWAPQAKDDKKIVDAFRKYWDEMEAANPWDVLDYSPENVELTRKLISEALDDNPIMKWAFETHGSPMIGILSKEAVEAYENTPSLKAKLEEIQRRRNLKNRPTFGAKTTPRFDLVSFNSSRIRDRVNNEETIVPWLFGAGKPTDSTHHVDNSVAGTLLHEWGHWIHFRAIRDYEIGMSGKPSNRIAYYGTGNPQDNSYIQALSVAAEYNQTSMDSEMMERHRAGGDINETKDKPRLLTSYGNVNMAESMAEGIAAYLHPNQEMKYLVMNEKLRRDVESILNIEDGETPWESIAQSTERSLSSGITEKQRSVFDERIDRAKKEIEQRAYDKFVKKFDDGLDEDFEKFGTPVDGKLVLPEKDAKKLFTESIQRLIKSKRVQELFEGLAPYDWRGREAMFQAGLVKGDIASRIAESIQFTPEEFISTFKRSSLDSADPNHASYKKFLSFEDSKNFKMIEAILSGDNKVFGLNLRTGDIEPQGVAEEVIKARQATHEIIELTLRERTIAEMRQAFRNYVPRTQEIQRLGLSNDTDPYFALWQNLENTSNDSNQLLKYAADPKPVGPNPPPWNPDKPPLPPKDPLQLEVRAATVTRTNNIVDDVWSKFSNFNGTWIDEISKNPNTAMRMYSLKNIETGQMHGDIFFADDNPNISWFEQKDLQKNIESNYGEFNQDDWEAVVITKDNWDSKTTEDVFTAQIIKLLSDEYGMGMNARFKGTQIFDADTPEGVKKLKQTIITDLIHTWAISSNDENIVALTMQNIIRKEFGLSDAIGWDRSSGLARNPKQTEILPSNVAFDSGIELSPDAEAMLRNVVRAQYEATQEYFKIRNIEYVALYRGVTGLNDKEVKEKIAKFEQRDLFQPIIRDEIVMRPASSWSFEPSTAEDFTTASNTNTENPAIIKSFVPVKNILSIPFTGFGCLHEEEAVVLGKPIDAYVGVYSNRVKNVPKYDKFLSDKLKAEDGILGKIVAITPEEFFSNKDANEVSDMGLDIASEIKKALSSGSTAKPTHKIKYEIAELMKRSRSLDVEYEIDEERAELYNGTLRKGFRGGFTVQVDHHSDVKSGIAIARNKHGLNFDAKTDFSSDGTPSADLVRRFHAWMMFHGPLTFKNPRDGAKEVTIGGWLAKGKIYLDVVDVYPNTSENKIMASRLGKKERQIAITDLDELYRLIDAGEENLDSAFISTGGDGGQTLNVRTIDKFASLMTQLDSNMARTGSNHLKEIGRLQKFKERRRALASRRVRFSDPANPSKEVDYMLVALPGDGENETILRAYDYSAIDVARDAVAESRGANRRDISLGDSLDYILDPSRQNLRINKPIAEITVKPRISDNAQFEVQPQNVQEKYSRRGIDAALQRLHEDINPTPVNSLSSGDESRINLSDEEKREIIAIASQRTDSFSQSVVSQFRRNGILSDKQWRKLNSMTLRRNSLSSGQNPVVPANKRYNNIKGDGKGNCFDSAANLLTQLVADNPERSGDFKLVHGAPLGTGGEAKDIRFHHAWVEETVRKTDDEIETIINNYPKNMREQVRRQLGGLLSEQVLVHDNSNGREVFMPREVYYSIGNIDGDLVQKYSLEEMSKKQRENKHYGPYDLDEETESMSSDQSALLDEMESIREELENYLGTDDLESLENWVMNTEWPKDYLDVVSGKDYEFDEHYVVLQERLKSAGIPDVVVVRRQGTPSEKGNIRNGSMVSGWKGGSGKYHYGKDRKIFESLVPRENIVGIGHVEEGEIFYKLDGVETTELSLSSGRINKPSKKTTRKSSQKSNLPDTAVFAQTSRAQKKTKQINFEITPIDKNDDRVSWLDTKPTINVSDPALPSVLREYSELIKWLDGKPSSWSSNGYSNTELLLRPNDRWDLNEFLIQSRAWISPAKFVEIKDKKGRKKIYAIVHSGPEEINVYDVEQLEKDLRGKFDFRNWDDIKEIYTYDSKFKKRKSVIAAKLTARRGPERDSPWEISRVLVTPKHEGIGIGKTMIDFHREEFAELEATFKYRDPRSQAYGNYRSQYAPIRQQIPGPWNNSIFMNPEDPDLPNEETASLSSGARRTTESMKPRRDGQLSLSSGDDYRGQHEAPGRGSGAPLHDLISPDYSVYPEDVYSSDAIKLYGVGDEMLDPMTDALIKRFKGKPNAEITIYRAAPVSRAKQIEKLEKQIARYMSRGKRPAGFDRNIEPHVWSQTIRDEIERLKKLPPDDFQIRSGDWVTPLRQYAVNHGEGSLRGEYEIVKKRVKAKHIYTAGDSWLEWGYDDSGGSLSMSSGDDRNLNIYSEKIDAKIVSSAIAKNKRIDGLRKERIKDLNDNGYGDDSKSPIERQDEKIQFYMDQDGEFASRWKKKPYPVLTDMEEAVSLGSPHLIPLSEIEKEAKKLGITIRNPKHRIEIRERKARVPEPYDADAHDKELTRIREKRQSMNSEDTITDWSDLEILVMDLSFEILNDDIELNETNNSESKRQKIREEKPDSRPGLFLEPPNFDLRSFDSLSMDEQEELITSLIKNSIRWNQYQDLSREFSDRAEFSDDSFREEDGSIGTRISYDHGTLKRKPRKKTRADYIRQGEKDYERRRKAEE